LKLPLGTKIFLGTALVVVAVLAAALLVTKGQADRAADAASERAVRATRAAIQDALDGRSHTLRQLTAALVQVPAYVSRIGESLRGSDRANLLDQVDELRSQTGADWVLVTDGAGVLKAWTAQRNVFDEDFSRGALIGRLDPKAHRKEQRFEVKALHLEPGVAVTDELVADVAGALHKCAVWHKTPEVDVRWSDPPELAALVQRAIERR